MIFNSLTTSNLQANSRQTRIQLERDDSGTQLCKISVVPSSLNGEVNFAPDSTTPTLTNVELSEGWFSFSGDGEINCGELDLGTSNFTLSFGFVLDSVSSTQGVCGCSYDGRTSRFSFFTDGSDLMYIVDFDQTSYIEDSLITVSDGVKYIVSLVCNRATSTVDVYVNGVLATSTTDSSIIPSTGDFSLTNDFRIGASADASNNPIDYFDGRIGSVYLKTKALSPTEVENLFLVLDSVS